MDAVFTICLVAATCILLATVTAWLLLRGRISRIPTQVVIGCVVVFLIVREVLGHLSVYDLGLIAIVAWVIFGIYTYDKRKHDQEELKVEQELREDAEQCRREGMSEERIARRHDRMRQLRNERAGAQDDWPN